MPQLVSAAVSMTPTQGIVGSTIVVTGLPANQPYLIKWDNSDYSIGVSPSNGIAAFIVPENKGGLHIIEIQSPPGNQIYTGNFTVLASITLDNTSGEVGDKIVISGMGFYMLESSITIFFDDIPVRTNISADVKGSWFTTVYVPESCYGTHYIRASGPFSGVLSIEKKLFQVRPSISLNPAYGSTDTMVKVNGSGFTDGESIRVIFSNTEVVSGITVDPNGAWSAQFTVPVTISGKHTITIKASLTPSNQIPTATFQLAPLLTLNQKDVKVSTEVEIQGKGFAQNETGINLILDNKTIKSGISADSHGSWSVKIVVPPSEYGTHTFTASGNSTNQNSVIQANFHVIPDLTITPESGNVGDFILINGSGFTSNSKINITWSDNLLLSAVPTDTCGSFSTTTTTPAGTKGKITIKATDSAGIYATNFFNMDSVPPHTPMPISPTNGERIGYVGKSPVTFLWSAVSDPSGVYYELQVCEDPYFKQNIIEVKDLTNTVYKLNEKDALPHGEYYWRIRAVDRANNYSDWSSTYIFKIAYLKSETMYLIIGGVVLLIIMLAVLVR